MDSGNLLGLAVVIISNQGCGHEIVFVGLSYFEGTPLPFEHSARRRWCRRPVFVTSPHCLQPRNHPSNITYRGPASRVTNCRDCASYWHGAPD